ncbi:MAG: 2,3,4,5-tetrahydropyridine-2,6-dicarboxylate N-succinyltransferase [Deltaproteobacteria bacterium]|nr:2,3,4,5-tetrahydropyridine-2,6-dicarboxylate N-succinyltransferase [Deltaproteobacteria bacterium]
MADHALLQATIEAAFADRTTLTDPAVVAAVEETIALLDRGELRVATPPPPEQGEEAEWTVNAWVKQAILLYFGVRKMEPSEVGPLAFHDKIPVKKDLAAAGVRVVPPGTVRFGAFLEKGAIVMPGYVNIGAWVGSGSMVDTWATVGSCAQIGRDVHLAGGVGIGGVLEPPGARPVIVEDGAFIGSRVVIVEGMRIGKGAIIGAGVVLTASTLILDVRGSAPVERKGSIPPRAVVIPGVRQKKFPAGEFGVPCALIIGERSASTDQKVSLNAALRDFDVPV